MRFLAQAIKGVLAGVLLAAAQFGAVSGHAQGAGDAALAPFAGLSGTWSGTGSITLGTGERERLRCRVTYEVSDNGLQFRQDLRCASDSYTFNMTSDINYVNGELRGQWSELSRKKNGTLFGRASPASGRIEALAETAGFSAFLTLITHGNQQSVKIESKSPDLQDVSITLRRSSR